MIGHAASSVAHFYAQRIIHFRSLSTQPFGTASCTQVQDALDSLLWMTQRMSSSGYSLAFHGLQWALFIAAIETRDMSQYTWIMSKITSADLRSTITRLKDKERRTGGIISMGCFKQFQNYMMDS
jgi:hypothetical protein